MNNNNTNNNINNKKEKESNENNEKSGRKLTYRRSYKSSRSRELNLNDIESKNALLNKVNENKNSLNTNNKTALNNSSTNNDIGKRSHSISINQTEGDNNKNELSYRNKNKAKIIMISNSNTNNTNTYNSPKTTFKKKIVNIPFSKVTGINNKNYSAYTYEKVNVKQGNKFSLNKNKK